MVILENNNDFKLNNLIISKMSARIIPIKGSDTVMAVFGKPGIFYKGEWKDVKITNVGTDKDTPLNIRKSLVGLTIPTIFSKEQIESQTKSTFLIPKGSRLAYSTDVITALESAGKTKEAEQLKKVAQGHLDMYVFEQEVYEFSN